MFRSLASQSERLHLPPESELKAALHDLLLEKHPIAVEPAEAYEVLATTFALSERLRNKPMENTDENQWQDRVRQSRRKLVDDGNHRCFRNRSMETQSFEVNAAFGSKSAVSRAAQIGLKARTPLEKRCGLRFGVRTAQIFTGACVWCSRMR